MEYSLYPWLSDAPIYFTGSVAPMTHIPQPLRGSNFDMSISSTISPWLSLSHSFPTTERKSPIFIFLPVGLLGALDLYSDSQASLFSSLFIAGVKNVIGINS